MADYAMASNGVHPNVGRWVLFSTILASSMAFIDGSALNVALPAIQASLQATGAQLLWVVNGYLLMLAALILVGGALGDRLGRKRIFMAGISLFVLASIGCGLAPTIHVLIWARIIEGIGSALMLLFARGLDDRAASLNLSPAAHTALQAEAARLGAAAVPASVAPESAAAVEATIKQAFVDAFRLIMFTCTGMAWLAALLAGVLVESRSAGPKHL
jgi:MFS family permease